MKWNNLSLSKAVKNSKLDFVSLSKYFLGTLGLILLSAIIIISSIGMKLGFDYKGGTIIEVVYGVEANGTTYSEQDARDRIETDVNFFDYNLKISSYATQESTFGDRVVYKLTSPNKLTEDQLSQLKSSLYTGFWSYDEENIIHAQYIRVYNVGGTAGNVPAYAAIALSVSLIVFAIAVLIRYGLSQAISTLIVSVINILILFAFVIICRIPVDSAFIASIFSVFALTIIGSLIFFDKTRENLRKTDLKGFTKNKHSNLALRECFNILFLVFAISLIAMILVSGLGVASIRTFGIPLIFGVLIVCLSTYLALPYFWTIITFKKRKGKK